MILEHRGCRLAYEIAGSGPPVLFIQGTGVGGSAWKPQVDALAARHACLTFDNRGFGASQPVGAPLSVEQMADDALALAAAAGWQDMHVVGHSLGGLIALFVARAAPARVKSLSLLCTFASGRVPTKVTPWLVWVGTRTKLGTRAMRRRAFLEMVLAPGEEPDRDAAAARIGGFFGYDLAAQPPIAMKQLGAARRADATPFLGELRVPALIVSAAHDRLAPPAAGRALAAGIPGARYIELDGAAHAVPISQPARVNDVLSDFLQDGANRTKAPST
jgi:pimeloyl-ACP methyl ester carboxylesterase